MGAQRWNYAVFGNGCFPDDMLRYDQAKIVGAAIVGGYVCVVIEGKTAPTVERWQSFMWNVFPGKYRYPGNDPENGPAELNFRVRDEWKEPSVWFSRSKD